MTDSITPSYSLFDEETWGQLPSFFDHLPEPVCLNVWGDVETGQSEYEAARLCRTLAERFAPISWQLLPRRANYFYYPVIGVMGGTPEATVDYGVRLIGLPAGYQITSLIAAIQAVSFKAQTLEPLTRIKLHKALADPSLPDIGIELLTAASDEAGPPAAKTIFGMAVAAERVRAFLVMTDAFPAAALRFSVRSLPHVVVNGRVHFSGVPDEAEMLRQIGLALNQGSAPAS